MVYCVGLTGNIASGKSTVSRLFSELGIDVFSADAISRELTARGQPAFLEIVAHFGDHIIADGNLDRPQLRDIIFCDEKERFWLENLLHPLIRAQLKTLVANSQSSYSLVEIPLLISKQNYPYINRVLVVTASEETQISRVMARDKCTRELAQLILHAQPELRERLNNADDRLINDTNIDNLRSEVIQLHQNYLLEAKKDA